MSVALALPDAPGIDLNKHHHDVRRLAFAAVRGWLPRSGIDDEDFIQTVYQRILVRNAGSCAWDPAKGTLGCYVHRLAKQTLATMVRDRRTAGRSLVLVGARDRSGDPCDARDLDYADPTAVTDEPVMLRAEAEAVLERIPHRVRPLAAQVLADRLQGMRGADTVRRQGASQHRVSRARGWLRRAALGEVPVVRETVRVPEVVQVVSEPEPEPEWMTWGVDEW